MKFLCVFAAVFAVNTSAPAAIKIPKGVFVIGQYEEALKAARQQKKALAVVQLDEAAEGKGAEEMAEEAFKAVTANAVVLFVSTLRGGDDLNELAPPLGLVYIARQASNRLSFR